MIEGRNFLGLHILLDGAISKHPFVRGSIDCLEQASRTPPDIHVTLERSLGGACKYQNQSCQKAVIFGAGRQEVALSRMGKMGLRVRVTHLIQPLRDSMRVALRGRSQLAQDAMVAFRLGVIIPAMMLVWLRKRWAAIHAAAVDIDGKALVVIGGNASGKTTLALALAEIGRGNLLADNYCLVDGQGREVCGIPELLRVSPEVATGFGLMRSWKIAPVFNRWVVERSVCGQARMVPIHAVLFVSRGQEPAYSQLAPEAAVKRLLARHREVGETPDFGAWPGAAENLGLDFDPRQPEESLAGVASVVKSFDFIVKSGSGVGIVEAARFAAKTALKFTGMAK